MFKASPLPRVVMGAHEVDLTGSECYFCGKEQKQLDEMQKKVDSVLGRSASSSSTRISQYEENHNKKVSEAKKILKRIKGKLKLSTIRTDMDAFVGEEEPESGDSYSETPAINIVRSLISRDFPIQALSPTEDQKLLRRETSIEVEDGEEFCMICGEYVDDDCTCEFPKEFELNYQFTEEEIDKSSELEERWIDAIHAREWGYSYQLTDDSLDTKFKDLLPIYLEWIPLKMTSDFSWCEDYVEARKELAEKGDDAGKVPKFGLHKLGLHSGSSEDVNITITRCTICADQMNLVFSELAGKENATTYH
tara:strand:+ start:331 stop:1251 length:921 start_codon:yes stop_codon:yes gene_type:complete